MNPSSDLLVETRAVSKHYGKTFALNGVSVAITAGCSVALLGRNGAGKSTLVRMLTGLDRPDEGEVLFEGVPAPDISARAHWQSKVACVYQKSTIIPDLTVAENVFLNSHLTSNLGKISWKAMRNEARRELDRWGLDVDVHRRAGNLTVGERQLLEIARTLRKGSRFIILDEPTAQLEVREIKQLFGHMERLKKEGVTFLFISHHLQEIYQVCESAIIMRDGRVVTEAPVANLSEEDIVSAMVGGAAPVVAKLSRTEKVETDLIEKIHRPVVLDVSSVSVPGLVSDVSLQVRAGERVGIAGLKGSGKVELAEAIVGERVPSKGSVSVNGSKLRPGRIDIARDLGVGYVPEDRHTNGFCPNLGIEENIALPVLHRLTRNGVLSSDRRRTLADRMMSRLQIKAGGRDQNVSELSGGNQQKTVMARALASDPSVLVLVCPTAGVDIASKVVLFDTITASRSGVLLVSDEMDELSICDRVLVMFDGKLVREFSGDWNEHEMVAATEGLGV